MSFYRKAKFRLKGGAELEIDMHKLTRPNPLEMSWALSQNSNEQGLGNEQYK